MKEIDRLIISVFLFRINSRLLLPRFSLLGVFLLFFCTLFFEAEAKTAAEVFHEVSASVVVIYNYDAGGKLQSRGSGIVLPSGNVATNYHVIEKAGKLTVLYQGREYLAKPGYADRFRDVCSLVVSGLQGSQISFGDTNQLKVGNKVYAIGAPQGFELTFSDGIISGLRAVDKGYYIQSTAPISIGSSGGGLFDENGRMIGMPTYFFKQGEHLNFALPVEWIIDLPNRHVVLSQVGSLESELLYQVNSLEEKQDWSGMIELCRNWVKKTPSSGEAWGYLGFASLQKGDLVLSVEAYQHAVRLRPDCTEYWGDLAVAWGRQGAQDKKLEAYRHAVMLDHDYVTGWIHLGITYLQNGEYEKAVEAYRQAVRINSGDASSWNNMSIASCNAGLYATAIEAGQQAVHLVSGNAQYWLNLGQAYGMDGQLAKQLEAYREALRVKPDYAEAWVRIGSASDLEGKGSDAFDAYQKALVINPDHNTALFNLGHNYLEQGNRGKGLEIYSRLKQLNPELAQVFFCNLQKSRFSKTVQ